jgi:hypothetical protein
MKHQHWRSIELAAHRQVIGYLAAGFLGAGIAVSSTSGEYHPAVAPLGVLALGCLWWTWQLTQGIESIERLVKWIDEEVDPDRKRLEQASLEGLISRPAWRYILP